MIIGKLVLLIFTEAWSLQENLENTTATCWDKPMLQSNDSLKISKTVIFLGIKHVQLK